MSELNQYVERQNFYRVMFKQAPIDLSNATDRQFVGDKLSCDLSPENLHCDGEISHDEAMKKYRYLMKCVKSLVAIDPLVKIDY